MTPRSTSVLALPTAQHRSRFLCPIAPATVRSEARREDTFRAEAPSLQTAAPTATGANRCTKTFLHSQDLLSSALQGIFVVPIFSMHSVGSPTAKESRTVDMRSACRDITRMTRMTFLILTQVSNCGCQLHNRRFSAHLAGDGVLGGNGGRDDDLLVRHDGIR